MKTALLLLALGFAGAVTPVEKVSTLIETLKAEVEDEGKEQARVYNKFACFCRKVTGEKSDEIEDGLDDINDGAASVESLSSSRDKSRADLDAQKKKKGEDESDLAETTSRCESEITRLTAKLSGLDGDLARLGAAISNIAASTRGAPALLEVRQLIRQLQPGETDYESHTGDIVDTLNDIKKEYEAKRAETDTELSGTTSDCTAQKNALNKAIDADNGQIKALEDSISSTTQSLEKKRSSLVDLESKLQGDDVYLKDLTKMCEQRGKEWDQRSKMRADEVQALGDVLDILKNRVQGVEGKRALFLQLANSAPQPMLAKASAHERAPSLLQAAEARNHVENLGESRLRDDKVVALLRKKGQQLKSTVLSQLARRIDLAASSSEDPFAKVKLLIQGLLERLVKEATEEASKKGWCDTETASATTRRDFRIQDVQKLLTKIGGHRVDLEEATQSRETNQKELDETTAALTAATTQRDDENKVNVASIKDATEGYKATKEVLGILHKFYGKAASFLQQAPPSEAQGSYGGKTEAAGGIIGMIEVIMSDFERTKKTTQSEEKTAQAEYVEFKAESLATIKAKETAIAHLASDQNLLTGNIESGLNELNMAQKLLDQAVFELEDLVPQCVDTGMSFDERSQKREDEIGALNCAKGILEGGDSLCAM